MTVFDPGERIRRLADTLEAEAARQTDNAPAYAAVAFGLGVALYFGHDTEPALWPAPAILIAALVLRFARPPQRLLKSITIWSAVSAAAGFATAQWHAHLSAAPVLERPLGAREVAGRVVSVETTDRSWRVVLDRVRLSGVAAEETPARVRLLLTARSDRPETGAFLRVSAEVMPPPAPAAPGAYNFPRDAWFDRIGAVGYAVERYRKPAENATEAAGPHPFRPLGLFDRARTRIEAHLNAALAPESAAVAAALITGARRAVPEPILEAYRHSGLAHLLAISGLHMTLAAGIAFVVIRRGLALIPRVALSIDIKKLTAVLALLVAAGYLILSGASVPTQRAFAMVAIVMLAVLLDRDPISMRLWGAAVFVVLLAAPVALIGPSFQMSFAAVAALLAAYELPKGRETGQGTGRGWRRNPLAVLLLTSVIATGATAPFVLYHFNKLALFGVFANLFAVPALSFVVMPLALLAIPAMLLTAPGHPIAAVILWPMGLGIEWITAVARFVADLPYGLWRIPALPNAAMLCAAAGLIGLCLWRGRARFVFAAVGTAAAVTIGVMTPVPDILIDESGRLVALRQASGGHAMSPGRGERFAREIFAARLGRGGLPDWPGEPGAAMVCDPLGCGARLNGRAIIVSRHPAGLREDCQLADILIAADPVPRYCTGPDLVIDRFDLWRAGGHAVFLPPPSKPEAMPRVVTVKTAIGQRLWTPRRMRERLPERVAQ